MSFNWKAVIGTVAPTLATALLGPLGGVAISAIGGILGITDPNEQKIEQAMQHVTPDQLLALKQEDNKFKTEMAQKGIDLEKLSVANRVSARKREEKTGDSFTPKLLAMAAACFFLLNMIGTFILIFLKIELDSTSSYLLGWSNTASVALLKEVYGYYFGSSSGSIQKDTLLAESTSPKTLTLMEQHPGIKVIPRQ